MTNQREVSPLTIDSQLLVELKRALDSVKDPESTKNESGWRRLIEFLSAHIIFILASGAGPFFSHGIGLPTPHPAASYIATLLCVLTGLGVLAGKETIAFWSAHGRLRARLTPLIMAGALGIAGAVSFTSYLLRIPADGKPLPGAESMILFLLMWPSFTGAVWTLLTILYYHFGSDHRQRAVIALLNKYYPSSEVLRRLEQVAKYKQLSGDIDVLQHLGLIVEDKLASNLDDLAMGRLRVDPADVGPTFTKVAKEFLYYDGVSACELQIWLPGAGKGDSKELSDDARQFFDTNAQLVQRGGFVCTRIFVVRRDEIKNLRAVLERHSGARIGWAVVMFEELSFELQHRVGNDEMHFGLFDGGKDSRPYAKRAYAQFHLVDRNPHMTLGFKTVSRGGADLEKHVSAYEELVSLAVWMDDIFEKRHAKLLRRIRDKLSSSQQQVMTEIQLEPLSDAQAPIVSTKESIVQDFERFTAAIRASKAMVAGVRETDGEVLPNGKASDSQKGGGLPH